MPRHRGRRTGITAEGAARRRPMLTAGAGVRLAAAGVIVVLLCAAIAWALS